MNPSYDRLLLGDEPESRPVRITLTARQSDVDLPFRIESTLFGDFFPAEAPEMPGGEGVTPENAPEALEYALDDIIDRDSDGYAFPADPDNPNAPVGTDGPDGSFDADGPDVPDADDVPGDGDGAVEAFWRMLGEAFRQMEENGGSREEEPLVATMLGVMEKKRRGDGGIDLEISYEDAQLGDGTRTAIRLSSVEPGVITVSRFGGEATSMLVCEEGVRHVSMYRTPYAVLELAVLGRRCESTVTWRTGGVIRLDYLFEFHGADLQYTEMTIRVEPM